MRCHSVAGRAHTRTVDSIFECTFFVRARQSLHGRTVPMILRAVLASFPLAICVLVVVLAYRKTRDR
jgi:hypothetical protein